MPLVNRIALVFLAVSTVVVTTVTTASADPLFLFGGQTGKISEGAGLLSTLTQLFAIECKAATGHVEAANDSDAFKGEIELTGCSMTGLGLAQGVVKFKFKGLTCLWGASETELKPCAYIEATEDVHMEVPIIGLVVYLKGSSQAGKLSPDGAATATLKLTLGKGSANGDQELTSVKDLGAELKPKINILEKDAGEETMGAISTTFAITYANPGTLDCS